MACGKRNWQLLLDCAQSLTARGVSPFRRADLVACVQRTHPDRDGATLGPIIQGMTANAPGGPTSAGGLRLRRIGRARYVLIEKHGQSAQRAVGDTEVSPAGAAAPDALAHPSAVARQDRFTDTTVVLVGCVKTKADRPMPARQLYQSELFHRRRAYAEASGKPWLILSALHGVVDPDAVIEPYDVYLEEQPTQYRREWGRRVVAQLEQRFQRLDDEVFEVHASAAYVQPLADRLERGGARVVWPFRGRRFGEHLSWYSTPQPIHAAGQAHTTLAVPADLAGTNARSGLAWRITEAFCAGQLDLRDRPEAPAPSWAGMPEVAAVRDIRSAGADPVKVRLFCTFVMAMDRARDADILWQHAARLFRFAPWAYQPAELVRRSLTELADALRRFGVSQRHVVDSAAWRVIAESLADSAAVPELRQVVYEGTGDAIVLLDAVTRTTPEGTPLLPLLQGPKIAPVWLRMLAYPGGARIDALDQVPVAVDVQVRKVSEYLDVARTRGLPLEQVRGPLQQLWGDDVNLHDAEGPPALAGTPAATDPALWFYGKWGCTRCEQAKHKRPISSICDLCPFDELSTD